MKKAEHKRVPYTNYVADRLRHRGIFCITPEWTKWAKRHVNKAWRRTLDADMRGEQNEN